MDYTRLKIHLITSFIILPLLLMSIVIPIINIFSFIILALLSFPFGILMEFAPKTFIENHFEYVFIMLGPSDFIGWVCWIIYFLILFNLAALTLPDSFLNKFKNVLTTIRKIGEKLYANAQAADNHQQSTEANSTQGGQAEGETPKDAEVEEEKK